MLSPDEAAAPGRGKAFIEVVRALEQVACNGWPPVATEEVGGWQLQLAEGTTNRNSCTLTLDWQGANLAGAVAAVEARYRAAGALSRFKILPGTRPAELDSLLAARGYREVTPSHVLVARNSEVHELLSPVGGPAVVIAGSVDDEWMEACWERPVADLEINARVLARLGGPVAFALARGPGSEPLGTALGVISGNWCYVSAVQVASAHRRKGVARALMAAVARWALRQGAQGSVLQVERSNVGAKTLYAGAGYHHVYDYWYRVRPS
jgi:N-acetylglutamate synthase